MTGCEAGWPGRCRLLLVLSIAWLCDAGSQTVECGYVGPGTALVADAAASQGKSVAVEIGDTGSKRLGPWPISEKAFPPGLYKLGARVKLWMPADFDLSRLECSVVVGGRDVSEGLPAAWHTVNASRHDYTELEREVILLSPAALRAFFAWRIVPLPPGERPRPARPRAPPEVRKSAGAGLADTGTAPEGEDEFLDELDAQSAAPVSSITYPAYLIDRVSVRPVTQTVIVESVRPEKVHVYPGEPNPITVTVRNFQNRPVKATVKLSTLVGLDEVLGVQDTAITVPASGTVSHRFEWVAGKREYGHEARAEVFVDGKRAHYRSDCFTVSTPIWKTAIQGGGFLSWHGLEYELGPHVEANRRKYVNVEEAFSWQPSSWTDLNPTGEHWWAGQNNFHNSMKGLLEWISRSHAHGIKMITYLLPTTSGPSGLEWARRYPEVLTHSKVGLNANFDVEDLRLYPLRMVDPALWDYQPDIWQRISLHRGYLKTAVLGADEVIRSAKRFGWDGVRFDGLPTWGPIRAETVHQELEELGLSELMKELVPEHHSQRDGKWSGSAISARNTRYMKHRFWTEIGPNFAIAANYHLISNTEPVTPRGLIAFDFFRSYCAGGCQVNQERLRKAGRWSQLVGDLLTQVEYTRQCGGYHGTQALNKAGTSAARTFMNVFIFATGSHPYCYAPPSPSPGSYSRFMTRYGEFCWDLALDPVSPEEVGLNVAADEGLFWKRFVRQRKDRAGRVQTVVHLISQPRDDKVAPEQPVPMPEWRRSVVVSKQCDKGPDVWLLSAEPQVRAEKLPVRPEAGAHAVTVPEHRLWSILVWNEERP